MKAFRRWMARREAVRQVESGRCAAAVSVMYGAYGKQGVDVLRVIIDRMNQR